MSVVVSDTSPLHYVILCGAETALPRLFMERLRQTNARLDPGLIHAALERNKARKQARQGSNG